MSPPIRIMAIVGDFTRECLASVADTSLRVIPKLDAAIARRGRPVTIVSTIATKLNSLTMRRQSKTTASLGSYIALVKPQQNVFVESFDSRLWRPMPQRDAVHCNLEAR